MIAPAQGLPDYIVTVIAPAGNNTFWVGLQDKGICLYDHATRKITVPTALSGWSKGQVNDLKYAHGNLWIATQDSGLLCYNASKNNLTVVTALNGLKKTVNKITEDEQGNIWVVADNNSIVRTASNSLQFYRFTPKAFLKQCIP